MAPLPGVLHRVCAAAASSLGELIGEREAAKILCVSMGTLRAWRCRGIGPAWVKLGPGIRAAVRYHSGDLERFVSECRQVPSLCGQA
jgi:hypothetical protein